MSKKTKLIFIFISLLIIYLFFKLFSEDEFENNSQSKQSTVSTSPAKSTIAQTKINSLPASSNVRFPTENLPLKNSFTALKQLLNENNPSAIMRLFKETQLCTQYQQRRQLVEKLEFDEVLKENTNNDSMLTDFIEKEKNIYSA